MKIKKITMTIAVLCATAVMALCLTACGGGAPALTGQYTSDTTVSFSTFLPDSNFFMTSESMQQIETYDDGTYCLTIVSTTISNLHVGPDVTNQDWAKSTTKGNDQGQSITKYYGTVTVTVDPDDENAITLKLAVPTRVTYKSHSSKFIDSATATEDQIIPAFMGQGDGTPATTYCENLLARFNSEKEVDVNGKNGSFKQITLG